MQSWSKQSRPCIRMNFRKSLPCRSAPGYPLTWTGLRRKQGKISMFNALFRGRLLPFLMQLALLFCLAVPAVHAEEDYLEPESAFSFSSRMLDQKTIEVSYRIADGYYMYRERFAFRAEGASLGEPSMPPGKIKFDETFQKNVETYRRSVSITLPVEANGPFTLIVTSQGCADKGLCYTPMDSQARLSPNGGSGLLAAARGAAGGPQAASPTSTTAPAAVDSDMGRIES